MQKIKYKVFDKIIKLCTDAEIIFLIYIAQYQNELGQVRGLDYILTCINLRISKQTFYNILRNLENKEIISVDWYNNKGKGWNVCILGNDFTHYASYREGYVNINKFFLHTPEFRDLKVGIKKLILKLLKVYRPDSNFKISYDKLLSWTNLKSRTLLDEYIEALKQYFNITFSKDTLIIKLKKIVPSYKDTDLYKRVTYQVSNFCRRYRIAYTLRDLLDVFFIFDNRKNTYSKIINALCDTTLRYRSLQPALINSIVSS